GRASDRRTSRTRRAALDRLLLRANRADLGCPRHGCGPWGILRLSGRLRGTVRARPYGDAPMRWLSGMGGLMMAVGLLLPARPVAAGAPGIWLSHPAALAYAWIAIVAAFAAAAPIERVPPGPFARLVGIIGAVLVAAGRLGQRIDPAVLLLGSL